MAESKDILVPGPLSTTKDDSESGLWNYWAGNRYQNGRKINEDLNKARRVILLQRDKSSDEWNEAKMEQMMGDGYAVVGYLNNEVSYGISAGWQTNDGMISKISKGINSMINVAGPNDVAAGAAGYATRKFYKGEGSDFKMSLTFKVYAPSSMQTTGIRGSLATELFKLKRMVLPTTNSVIETADIPIIKESADAAKTVGAALQDPRRTMTADGATGTTPVELEKEDQTAQAIARAQALGSNLGEGAQVVGGIIASVASNISSADITISNAPEPVMVSIGEWLVIPEAIVTDINFTYSKTVNKAGPVWCDIQLSLESRENLNFNNMPQDADTPVITGMDLWNSRVPPISAEDKRKAEEEAAGRA
jgi:hypothetical protein